MSLSGNLGFVPIDEVLRLLTRSRQQGSVEVTGGGLRGRVFVGKSGIDLATTFDDAELHRHLVNSQYADEKVLNRITSGETTLAAIADSNTALIDLLREMTVESLYQIADRGRDFEVQERLTTPYASPKSFDLEALLQDADERRKEWDKVTEVIPDLTGAIAFRRDLGGREEVTVKIDDWKVLSEIGTGSSVQDIAEHLGTTEFWTARVAAKLVKNDLVILSTPDAVVEGDDVPSGYEEAGITSEQHEVEPPSAADEYAAYEGEKPASQPAADPVEQRAFETPRSEDGGDASPHESWWQEPRDEDEAAVEASDTRTPEVASESLSDMPAVGKVDEDRDNDVEEDTEAFLEKVFSELGSSDSPESSEDSDQDEDSEPETEEGHGLLRRRRMGTLRDFSSDS